MRAAALRELLRAAFVRALSRVDLEERVARAMPPLPAGKGPDVLLLAVGKASPAMTRGALAGAPSRIARALVVVPEGVHAEFDHPRVEVLRAAHPDPDRRSVAAANRAAELLRASAFTVALVSGGASSLLCRPRSMSLARYTRVVRALLLGGATVREVNLVRRHLCAAKGGGLARIAGGRVHTLVVSDVIAGEDYEVGSGPTVPDPTTVGQARAALRRLAPGLASVPMHESLKPSAALARRLSSRFVARPEDLAEAMAGGLRARSMTARILPASVEPVEALAREYVARAAPLASGEALVRAAEPSLRVGVRHPGRGGRSSHLAVLVARDLPSGVAFLAGASDGADGTSGAAGAVVDSSLGHAFPDARIARALGAFDTAPLVVTHGMAITVATGHNLADLHVLARQ